MGPQAAPSFQFAKQRLDAWNDLKARLPQEQEQFNRQNYQLRQLESALTQIEQQIEQLESFSIGGLICSLLGRKEIKLTALREGAERLRAELEQATTALTETDCTVRHIEQQLTALGDPQRALSSVLEEIEQQILESESEHCGELADINAQLTLARSQRRHFQKAAQIGKHLIERLHNLTNSLGRTQQKLVFGAPLGVVGNVALNAAARHGLGAMLQRARDGLLEFARSMKTLDLSEGTELDIEVAKLGDAVEGLHAHLAGDFEGKYFCDPALTRSLLETVQTAIGHLQSKLDLLNADVARVENEKTQCIERAMASTASPSHS